MSEKNGASVQVIEDATLDAVRPGDQIAWERAETFHGVTRTVRHEGIAHHRDQEGDWCTKEGRWITNGEDEGTTLTIRRPIPTGA